MLKNKIKTQTTSLELSKRLKELKFQAPTDFYWIKTASQKKFRLSYMKGEFYTLPTTKTYSSYTIESFLPLLALFDDFSIQASKIVVAKTAFFKSSDETLTDTVARAVIYILEQGLVQCDESELE